MDIFILGAQTILNGELAAPFNHTFDEFWLLHLACAVYVAVVFG